MIHGAWFGYTKGNIDRVTALKIVAQAVELGRNVVISVPAHVLKLTRMKQSAEMSRDAYIVMIGFTIHNQPGHLLRMSEEAIKKFPNDRLFLGWRVLAKRAQGDMEGALVDVRMAMQCGPEGEEEDVEMTRDEAHFIWQLHIKRHLGSPDPSKICQLYRLPMQERVPEGCMEKLLKHIEKASYDALPLASSLYNLGFMYLALEQFELAQQIFETGVHFDHLCFEPDCHTENEEALENFLDALRLCKIEQQTLLSSKSDTKEL